MVAPHWPAWLSWLMFVVFFLTFIFVWMTMQNVRVMRRALVGPLRPAPAKNRRELEERYVAGDITRDVYERWKGRLR